MQKINCPNCPSFMARYDETTATNGIIELKCSNCKAIVKYDLKDKKVLQVERKTK